MARWPSALRVADAGSAADWATFVALTAIVLTLLLALARLSQSAVREDVDPPGRLASLPADDTDAADEPADSELSEPGATLDAEALELQSEPSSPHPDERSSDASDAPDRTADPTTPEQPPDGNGTREQPPGGTETPEQPTGGKEPVEESVAGTETVDTPGETTDDHDDQSMSDAGGMADLSTGALLVNVAVTQGLFGGLLLAAAWFTKVPSWAFGFRAAPLSTGLPALLVGVALGVSLYVVNEVGAASADAMGVEYDERLRSMLAPDTAPGWVVLFALVLPLIAGVEEFIFRAAVIGATTAGFGTSPWALAVVSSLAFALGHGAQGRLGIVVTGGLGFVLAGAFILTGSFLVVFVAHYLVNALEFGVHELLGIDWAGSGDT